MRLIISATTAEYATESEKHAAIIDGGGAPLFDGQKPDKSGRYRKALTPAQHAEWSAVISDTDALTAALAQGFVDLTSGTRGRTAAAPVRTLGALIATEDDEPKGK